MAWPLRFSSHGMIIGFFGEPARPIVEAIGMPSSMCVAWIVAVGERIANGCPAGALIDSGVDAILLKEALFMRDHDG